jgi:hypothetical protein
MSHMLILVFKFLGHTGLLIGIKLLVLKVVLMMVEMLLMLLRLVFTLETHPMNTLVCLCQEVLHSSRLVTMKSKLLVTPLSNAGNMVTFLQVVKFMKVLLLKLV